MEESKATFKIIINAKPNSKKNEIVWDEYEKVFLVSVKSVPEKGKANKEILKLLKRYFKAREVQLLKGATSTTKLVQVIDGQKPSDLEESS